MLITQYKLIVSSCLILPDFGEYVVAVDEMCPKLAYEFLKIYLLLGYEKYTESLSDNWNYIFNNSPPLQISAANL